MKFFAYCFVFLISLHVFSQKRDVLSDKEYQQLQKKAKNLAGSNVDSSIVCAVKINNSNNYIHKTFGYGILSYLYQLKGDSIKSKEFYKIALNNLNKAKPSLEKTRVNSYLLNFGGISDWKRGNLESALEKYQKGKALSEELKDIVQLIKFNSNIAQINFEVRNFKLAIKTLRVSEKVIDRNYNLYTDEEFARAKSNVNLDLGLYYLESYPLEKSKTVLLDSAEYFFKKTILYSKDLLYNKIRAQKNLSIVYFDRKDFVQEEKIIKNIIFITKGSVDYNLLSEYSSANFNLGICYYYTKKNKESLIFLKKSDSIYAINHSKYPEYILSNYYQSKIYSSQGDFEKALEHSKIYLENFENFESDLQNETLDVHNNLSNEDLKKEMIDFEKSQQYKVILKKCLIGFSILLLLSLVGYVFKQSRDKKIADKKVNDFIAVFKQKEAVKQDLEKVVVQNNLEEFESINSSSINIDEEKENRIIKKLEYLERKLEYLKPNFTQQMVAKKIKTNTTYLSYVVNKRFEKTFSEYVNELKINYAINEMISNPTYRKYSTQAIAESVGFKNAISFTKSFSKRTGVSPTRFIKKLEDENHNEI